MPAFQLRILDSYFPMKWDIIALYKIGNSVMSILKVRES